MTSVVDGGSPRDNRGIDLPTFKSVPIHSSEPWMVEDILGSTNHVAKALGTIRIEKGFDEIAR